MESTPRLLLLKLGFGFKVGCAVYETLRQVVFGNAVLVCSFIFLQYKEETCNETYC